MDIVNISLIYRPSISIRVEREKFLSFI